MSPATSGHSPYALVLSPRGRDAAIACSLIEQANVACRIFQDVPGLAAALCDDVAFALVTEDAVRTADLRPLADWIARQPAWSDLPFILITDHGGGPERNPLARRWLETLNNVSFIERPFHPTTLISVARVTAKVRRRQHETRDLLVRLQDGDARLRTALHAGRLRAWELDLAGSAGKSVIAGVESVLGRVHGQDRVRVENAIEKCLASGEDLVIEFRTTGTDSGGAFVALWLDVRARVVQGDDGKPLRLVGLSSDITERKTDEAALLQLKERLEGLVGERTAELRLANAELVEQIAERERTEEQLRHVQKLESIGQLTGGVAHDFNNLLTAVLGNLELLKKRLDSTPETDRLIEGAAQAAHRGAALTQRLLAFARRQALAPKPVDLAELVRDMTDLLRRSLGPTIDMKFDLPDRLPAARADPNQVEMALLNLAVNARDAMPDGGTLSISLDAVEEPAAPDLEAGRYLRLTVTDTGHGMDDDTLKHAVEPFFSTKEIGKGTGLGLSMIHGLAQQLDGALRLDSQPGLGTTARFLLPADSAPAIADAAEPAPPPDGKAKGAHLLYVDDDFLIGMSTVALLEDLGHDVIHAGSGKAALEILRSDKPVDLLITDYAMPGMTGMQLAVEGRKLRPGLPILLATGYADVPGENGLDLPRLSKPYQQRELAQHIQQLIG